MRWVSDTGLKQAAHSDADETELAEAVVDVLGFHELRSYIMVQSQSNVSMGDKVRAHIMLVRRAKSGHGG